MTVSAVPPELRLGLRNHWYPVLGSDQVDGARPVGITRLGEGLVVWRDAGGAPHVFRDRCGHRAAPLSLGDIVDGRLQCRYHGLQYDGTGQCRFVPIELKEDGTQAQRICVHSYPVEERGGTVWAYLGDVEVFPPPPLWTESVVTDPSYVSIVRESVWEANWLLIHDNTIDPAHVPFLHGHFAAKPGADGIEFEPVGPGNPIVTAEMAIDTIRQRFVATRTERGLHVDVKADPSADHSTFDEVAFDMPCTSKVWVPLPDNGHPVRALQYEYPIDADTTVTYAWLGRRVDSDADRERTLAVLEGFVWPTFLQVYMEDSWICRSQGDVDESRLDEHLLPSDVGMVLLRKLLLEEHEQQQKRIAEHRRGNGAVSPGGAAGAAAATPAAAAAGGD